MVARSLSCSSDKTIKKSMSHVGNISILLLRRILKGPGQSVKLLIECLHKREVVVCEGRKVCSTKNPIHL